MSKSEEAQKILSVIESSPSSNGSVNTLIKPRYFKARNAYLIPDFIEIQRKSFFQLLEKGLIEEFSKRNPITNRHLEILFYPEFYQLTPPEYNPRRAILISKSYSSKLYIPVQLTDKKVKKSQLKWVLIGNLPLMTKRGHFVLNGSPRVIVNQILRSPGIYFQGSIKEVFDDQWSTKPTKKYKRFYADLICLRGTWLRIEVDKSKKIWAQMKKVPKIPLLWFLLAMGLTERIIFKSVLNPTRLLDPFFPPPEDENLSDLLKKKKKKKKYDYVSTPGEACREISKLIASSKKDPSDEEESEDEDEYTSVYEGEDKVPLVVQESELVSDSELELESEPESEDEDEDEDKDEDEDEDGENEDDLDAEEEELEDNDEVKKGDAGESTFIHSETLPVLQETESPTKERERPSKNLIPMSLSKKKKSAHLISFQNIIEYSTAEGRNWIYRRFMNPRTYDLGSQGRLNYNRKLGISISPYQTTLTAQDVLLATDYLMRVEDGTQKVDDIDHLKNRRVRTSGELLQIQIGIGLVRLEKVIREKMQYLVARAQAIENLASKPVKKVSSQNVGLVEKKKPLSAVLKTKTKKGVNTLKKKINKTKSLASQDQFKTTNLINTKPFNGALREFFGSSPLSQFMDQLNPLAEITHKRRLSSMGPGGVTRDTATMAIRGIHPTHYGRICPIETPEGKNTGLVNSLTSYSRASSLGFLETPFYKVYKGQVQKSDGMYFLSAEQEEKLKVAAADVATSGRIGFLPKNKVPAKIAAGDAISKISRNQIQYIGVSPIQMISIATSLIPFVEHDDANRALMGSNMQRQAVSLVRAERPLVCTGLEGRAVSDSGHAISAKKSGFVAYVSGKKMVIYSIL